MGSGGNQHPWFLIVIMVAVLAGCGERDLPERPNLVVIVIDTLRSDRLVAHGAKMQVTPCLNRLAEEGFSFGNALAPSSWTKPSVASLFTGLYPGQHGALGSLHFNRNLIQLDEDFVTLAERLKSEGYRTAAFVTNPHLLPYYHFDQGFEEYLQPAGTADRLFLHGSQWLEKLRLAHAVNPSAPFFLYLHAVDPHSPYSPPERYRRLFLGRSPGPGADAPLTRKGEFLEILLWLDQFKFWEPEEAGQKFTFDYEAECLDFRKAQIEQHMPFEELSRVYLDFYGKEDPQLRQRIEHLTALYNAEAAFADETLRIFLKQLELRGLLDNTVVVVTSDHGEALLEHDTWGHGHNVYHEAIHVPFIFRIPSREGVVKGRCDDPVSLVDLYPTAMDLLGLSRPAGLSGISLWPVMKSQSLSSLENRPVFSEMVKQWHDHVACVLGSKKLVRIAAENGDVTWQYFDLAADPFELRTEPVETWNGDAKKLKALIEKFLENRAVDFDRKGEIVEPSEEEIEQLKALGYI